MRKFTFRQLAVSGLVCLSLSCLQLAAAAPSVQVGFSPEGSALQLVLKTIESARHDIRLMGYSFTSPEVVSALVRAKHRGVDVKIVLDKKGNRSKTSQAAMSVVVNAGIPLRTNVRYAIMHDKVICFQPSKKTFHRAVIPAIPPAASCKRHQPLTYSRRRA